MYVPSVLNGITDKVYSYDAFNRLKTANAGGNISSYTYNGDNLRQTKTVNGITTSHVYDGSNVIADINDTATYFIRGNGLALLKNDTGTYLTMGTSDCRINSNLINNI